MRILFIGVILFYLGCAAANLRAQLTIAPATLDLGRHQQEQKATAEVKLTNTGSVPLEILGVLADCSCTVATPNKDKLSPGESTTMEISVETRGYAGLLHKNVYVNTSVGNYTIPVELTVTLFKSWTIEPSTIVMPPSQKGQVGGCEATLQYLGEARTALGKIICTPSWLKVETHSDDGRLFQFKFVKPAEAPAGNYTVKVEVGTSDAAEPTLSFNVFVPITSALRVQPNPVILPTVKVGQKSTREVVIQGWNGQAAPRLELAHGTVRLLEQDGGKLRLEVSVTPPAPGPLTQLLRVYDGERLELELPVILRGELDDRAN